MIGTYEWGTPLPFSQRPMPPLRDKLGGKLAKMLLLLLSLMALMLSLLVVNQ